jgi:hypothetical protein
VRTRSPSLTPASAAGEPSTTLRTSTIGPPIRKRPLRSNSNGSSKWAFGSSRRRDRIVEGRGEAAQDLAADDPAESLVGHRSGLRLREVDEDVLEDERAELEPRHPPDPFDRRPADPGARGCLDRPPGELDEPLRADERRREDESRAETGVDDELVLEATPAELEHGTDERMAPDESKRHLRPPRLADDRERPLRVVELDREPAEEVVAEEPVEATALEPPDGGVDRRDLDVLRRKVEVAHAQADVRRRARCHRCLARAAGLERAL